ncbi:PTS sugar transporter subunit IIA [Salmonella enterica]|nr:PTS sugar transporter subunit IIA [Salmonella enterica]
MSLNSRLEPELILLNEAPLDRNILFNSVSNLLLSKNYVEKSYPEALIAREENHPTAMQLEKMGVAIPHVDIEQLGVILGAGIGLLAEYDVKGVLNLAMSLGAVMLIMPRMVKLLMEGLLPLSDAVRSFLKKRYPDRHDLYIGLDIAVAVGHPSVLSTALLLIPVAVLLSVVLPGNRLLPLGDLANIWVPISMVVLACRGNIVRAFIIGIPCLAVNLYVASAAAPILTKIARDMNFPVKTGGEISSLLDGGNPYRFWAVKIFEGNTIALVLIPVIFLLCLWLYRVTKKQLKADEIAENEAASADIPLAK